MPGRTATRGFADLIRALARIDGLERIRYTTSHPADMTDALIAAHGEVDKLMPYLHLPVQSGSDRILKAMNRSHTAETYLATLEKMRAARPDIAMSGDFIVGFPGETEEDFEATLQIVDAVALRSAYSFKYSPRPGTPAATMEDQIAREMMDERLQRLQARINEHQLAFNRAKVGRGHAGPDRAQGQACGPDDRHARPGCSRSTSRRTRSRATSIDVTLVAAGPNSMTGALAQQGGRLMARRDLAAVANDAGRARLELEFEQPYLLGPLFGDYDRHLITIEHRLGVHIAARGNRGADRGRAGCRGARPRRAGRPLQPARPGPRRRCRSGRGRARHGRPAATSTASSSEEVDLAAAGDDPHAQEDDRPALGDADDLHGSARPATT